MLRPKTLSVYPNPWHSLDHYGRPAGHCPKERSPQTIGHQGYIACEAVAGPIVHRSARTGDFDHDTVWHFLKEPVTVADTPYYRAAIRNGEVFAVDEKLVKEIFGPAAKCLKLDELLAREKAIAVAKWVAAHGEKPEDVDPFKRPVPIGAEAPAESPAALANVPAQAAPSKGAAS